MQLLASVVDDSDLGVTDVIRGADHIAKAAVQIQLFEALGMTPPAFGHLPMLTDGGGRPLGRRVEAYTVESFRDAGVEAMALNSLLARLGRGMVIEPAFSLSELAADLDMASFGRFPPAFDPAALHALNARLLARSPIPPRGPRDAAPLHTLTRAKEAFVPLRPDEVGLYVCGPPSTISPTSATRVRWWSSTCSTAC